MQILRDMETMKCFLDLVNFLNRYIPCLAHLRGPLRGICRKKEEFVLKPSVPVAFNRKKEEISKNVTLSYFNPKASTTLQTDASK